MKNRSISAEARVTVLLAEYRAMYDLALFRLNALDRRVPLTGSTLAASLAAALVLPVQAQVLILAALPLTLVWFLRTTINHARSFEDALRRIEQIEEKLNNLAGDELVRFQSQHPSRGKATGGRTGRESITAVLAASLMILVGCGALTMSLKLSDTARPALLCECGFVALYLVSVVYQLKRYRYGRLVSHSTG